MEELAAETPEEDEDNLLDMIAKVIIQRRRYLYENIEDEEEQHEHGVDPWKL